MLLLAVHMNHVGDVDFDISKTRSVLTDVTKTDIIMNDHEPQGPPVFRNAIHQQVVALCTRLRISLIIVDKLMAIANDLATSN
jgi:hypothetical protein